jgi:hypothetical protein
MPDLPQADDPNPDRRQDPARDDFKVHVAGFGPYRKRSIQAMTSAGS